MSTPPQSSVAALVICPLRIDELAHADTDRHVLCIRCTAHLVGQVGAILQHVEGASPWDGETPAASEDAPGAGVDQRGGELGPAHVDPDGDGHVVFLPVESNPLSRRNQFARGMVPRG